LSAEPHNQKPKISALRFAHGQTKVPNLFQDLTLNVGSSGPWPEARLRRQQD
jgi:hypothetical protein